jgi:tagatose 1,6-diphosphate aldolase
MELSLGKIRALSTLSTAQNVFTILALDHDVSLRRIFWGDAWASAPFEAVVQTKMEIVRHLAPHASAVLLDPTYGIGAAIRDHAVPGNVGLMAPVEDEGSASADAGTTSVLTPGWSIAQAKRIGVAGIKFYFYYNRHDAARAAREEAIVKYLVEQCAQYDIPLFAEPIHYGLEPSQRRRAVIENAQRISDLGADIMKLEFPIDVRLESDENVWYDACVELSQALPRPWTLLSAGVDYATFKRQVEIACQAGASGFVGGRAIWQEASDLEGAARTNFVQTLGAQRVQELSALAIRHGKSWREFFHAPPLAQDWFKKYV